MIDSYSFIPRDFAKSPARYRLTITETAILLGVLAAARKQDHHERHVNSIEAGAKAMAQQKLYQKTKAHAKEYASQAATDGFHRQMLRLKRLRPPEIIRVELTRTELLRLSGLSTDTRNRAKIDAVLTRLLGLTVETLPAPLIRFVQLRSGRLRLLVASVWIEPPYVKISLPLPTRSLVAVNLSMFLRTINRDGAINLASLCSYLGIDPALPSFSQRRSVRRALNAVNHVLIVRSPEPSHEAEHRKVPWFYKMMIKTGDRIRFLRAHPQPDDVSESEPRYARERVRIEEPT